MVDRVQNIEACPFEILHFCNFRTLSVCFKVCNHGCTGSKSTRIFPSQHHLLESIGETFTQTSFIRTFTRLARRREIVSSRAATMLSNSTILGVCSLRPYAVSGSVHAHRTPQASLLSSLVRNFAQYVELREFCLSLARSQFLSLSVVSF